MSDSRQPVIYIAGPFRGANAWEVRENIRRAERVSMECWQAGFAAICPHTNSANGEGLIPDEWWLRGDISIMLRCDAVLVVPDYEKSGGTKREIATAQQNGIPVFLALDKLAKHFKEEDRRTSPGHRRRAAV